MSVIYINPRLNAVECGQLIDCTPLVRNSAVSVKLVVLHKDTPYFWECSDKLLKDVLDRMKQLYPFVCLQACKYGYNVVYRITFCCSSIRGVERQLNNIVYVLNYHKLCFHFDY